MKIKSRLAALAAFILVSSLAPALFAAVPGLLSYQGTLRKNGILFNSTVSMEFRITDAAGSTVYWTSGSTDVAVTGGLFRYGLGSPNEAQFAAIPWKDITPYVQMKVDGNWMPAEPLYASAYALHSYAAETSSGTFTALDGDVRISTTSGNRGLVFQDGTVQYSAAGWAVSGQNTVTTGAGNAGVGVAVPQARLDVQTALAAGYSQIWRNSAGVVKASMTAAGLFYPTKLEINDGDANLTTSGVKFDNFSCTSTQKLTVDVSGNMVCSTDLNNGTGGGGGGSGTLEDTLNNGNNANTLGMVNLGNVAIGLGTAGTKLDVQAGASDAYSQFWRDSGGALTASMEASGVLDASGVTASSVTVAGALGVSAAKVLLKPGVEISSAQASQQGGVYISSHVYLAAGAKYYGDASALVLSPTIARLDAGQVFTGVNTFTSSFTVTSSSGAAISRLQLASGVEISSGPNNSGVYVSSSVYLAAGAKYYGDGSQLALSPNVALLNAGQVFTGVNTFTSSFTVTSSSGAVISRLQLASGVEISSGTSGVYVSSSVYLAVGAKYFGDGSALTGVSSIDTLGTHVATTTLQMSGFGINNVSYINASGPFTTSSSMAVAGALGIGAPRLTLNPVVAISSTTSGLYISSSVYLAAGARYYGDGSQLSGVNGTDNLGNHTLTQNLVAGPYWLSGDGTNKGISINAAGNVGVGINPATVRFEINDGDGNTTTSGVKFTNFACSGTDKLTADASGNLVCATDQGVGSGSGDTLTAVLGNGSNAGTLGMVNIGNVAIGLGTAGTRLDVQAPLVSNGYVQFWRDSGGNIVSSMTDAGILYADGSKLRNLPPGADNLGNHTATTALLMSNFDIKNAKDITANGQITAYSSITAAGALGVGTPRLSLNSVVAISSAPEGVYISSSIYLPAGARYYGDGSQLSGLPSQDNLGNHTLTQNLKMGTYWLSGDGGNEGVSVDPSGNVGIGVNPATVRLEINDGDSNPTTSGVKFTDFACTGTQKLTVDSSGNLICAAESGGGSGTLAVTLGNGSNAGALGMVNLGNVAIGLGTAGTKLDVQAAGPDVYTQFWRDSSGVIQASMSATGFLYADGSKLRGLPAADNLGNHTLTQNLRTGSYWISSDGASAGVSVSAAGNVGIGINPATVRLEINDADANLNTSGVKFTNFACSGTDKLTVDVSGNLVCTADQTGGGSGNVIDDLTATLVAGSNAGAHGMVNLGDVAIGLGTAGTRLDVQSGAGGYAQFWRDSGGTIVSSMTDTGILYADGSKLRGLPAQDNLGNHTLTENLKTGAFWLSNDGAGAGISVSAAGNVGIGVNPASARLEINDGDANTTTSGVKFTNFACSGTDKLTVDVSGNLVCASDVDTNIVDTLAATLGAGNNGGAQNINNLGSIALGLGTPGTRLDVKTDGGGYTQFWRDSGGNIVSSMTDSGILYADGSKLRNLPTSADNLGNHTATTALLMSNFDINNAKGITANGSITAYSSITAAGALGLGAPRLSLNSVVAISSAPEGVYISSSVYLPAGARYYGDGSQLSGLPAADNLGNHTLTQNLKTGAFWISSDGGGAGISVNAAGNVGIGINPATVRLEINDGDSNTTTSGVKFTNFACSGTDKLTVDVSGNLVCAADQSGGGGMANPATVDFLMAGHNIINAGSISASSQITAYSSMTVAGALGIGAPKLNLAPGVELSSSVPAFNGGVYVSTNIFIAGISSATYYYGDGSKLTGIATGGMNVIDTLAATLNAGANAANGYMVNISSIAVGRVTGAAALDAQAVLGDTYVQIWRDAFGNIVSSMSATGAIYAIGAGGGGGGGNFSNPATGNLDMQGHNIIGISNLAVGTLGIAAPSQPYIQFSTNVYVQYSLLASGHSGFGNALLSYSTSSALAVSDQYTGAQVSGDNIGISARSDAQPPSDLYNAGAAGPTATGASLIASLNFGADPNSTNGIFMLRGAHAVGEDRDKGHVRYTVGIMGEASKIRSDGGVLDQAVGGYFSANFPAESGPFGGGGSITEAYGVYAFNYNGSLASITTSYALYAGSFQNYAGGSITNAFGLYLAPQTGATAMNYNLYSAGTGSKNLFEGAVKVGSATGTGAPLEIQGDSNDRAIKINSTTQFGHSCTITMENSDCGTRKIGTNAGYYLCVTCI